MPRIYRVGVVGMGVAGATVASLMARAGHEVTLFERAPRVGPVGAGILLQPSGQCVLDRLGLLDRVAEHAEPIDELHAITDRGRTLIRLPYAEIEPGCRAFGLHRGVLFEALYRDVRESDIRIQLGHEIRERRVDAGEVVVLDTAGDEHGPFDFLVAADGSRSALRAATRLVRWRHEYAYGSLWAIGPNLEVRRKLFQMVQGTRILLGLLPTGEAQCSLFWSLRHDEKEALWRAGFDAWRATVIGLCPPAAPLFEALKSFDDIAYVRYQHVVMKSCHDDHTIFLGDAAHAMSPHLGQGINLAMIDALVFSGCLARADDFPTAFREYAALRRNHLRYYAWVTLLLTPFFQSNGFIKGVGRDIALPIMTHIPPIRRQMLITVSGLKKGLFGGKLTI